MTDADQTPRPEDRPRRQRPTAARVVAIVLALAVAVVILFTQVFPRVERYLEDPTFDTGSAVTTPAPATPVSA